MNVTLEYTRSQANDELMETLQNLEQEDSTRFERAHREWDKQNRDPNDVLLAAQERRKEIKEQIREMERTLKRQRPSTKKGR